MQPAHEGMAVGTGLNICIHISMWIHLLSSMCYFIASDLCKPLTHMYSLYLKVQKKRKKSEINAGSAASIEAECLKAEHNVLCS